MKNIEIDDNLYQHIVVNTQSIGESASSILRRLLSLEDIDENNDKLNNRPNDKTVASKKIQPKKSEIQETTTSKSFGWKRCNAARINKKRPTSPRLVANSSLLI